MNKGNIYNRHDSSENCRETKINKCDSGTTADDNPEAGGKSELKRVEFLALAQMLAETSGRIPAARAADVMESAA